MAKAWHKSSSVKEDLLLGILINGARGKSRGQTKGPTTTATWIRRREVEYPTDRERKRNDSKECTCWPKRPGPASPGQLCTHASVVGQACTDLGTGRTAVQWNIHGDATSAQRSEANTLFRTETADEMHILSHTGL